MSWKIEKGIDGNPELVISGFENGIADSPFEGIADIRNMNINTAPKQASVNFTTTAITLPPTGYTGVAFTSATDDTFTVASTAGFYTGMALTIVTVSGSGSGTAGVTYYVNNITATTFKLYVNLSADLVLNVTDARTGTFTVPTFGTPTDSVSSPSDIYTSAGQNYKNTFVMCSDGTIWYLTPRSVSGGTPLNTLQFLGNLLHSTAGTNQTGLAVFKNYLMAFMNAKIDYLSLASTAFGGAGNPSATWQYAWQDISSSNTGHRALSATDDALYFCNGNKVGSVLENAGETFDPTDSTTYTYNTTALALPLNDSATCLAQLGTNLLTGGVLNYVYPWDRISTSYNYPIILAENYSQCIVSSNSSAYIFAGQRGRIYITNGANIELFKKFPDSLSGTVEPYYNWGWGIYRKNQLYFTVSATNNSGTAISNFAGIWVYDLETGALRLCNSLSYGTYAGTVPTIVEMGSISPTGEGVYACWLNSTGGIDYTSANPYTNYEARIDTDIIPVGTFLTPTTFSNIEFKLAKPLVDGESVKLSQRKNLTSSFAEIGTTSYLATTDTLSYAHPVNFELSQWLQIRVETSSTATTPSYVPLLEIRLRK